MHTPLYITKHAHERYMERFGGTDSPKSVHGRENKIKKVVAFGAKVKPVDSLRVYFFNGCKFNGCKDVEYYMYRNIIAIVRHRRVITVLQNQRDEWEILK